MKRFLALLLTCLAVAAPLAVPQANVNVARAARRRSCEIHIWGSGASQALVAANDDELASCYNSYPSSLTITAVRCWANAGSPTVMLTNTGVSGHNILSGNLTCGTASFAAGSLTGTGADLVVPSTGTVAIDIVAASTATNIRVVVEMRL